MTWWDDAVGRTESLTRAYTAEELASYRLLSGDAIDQDEVAEPLIAGLFSTLLGVHLPGPGTNYLKQSMTFPSAATAGESLLAVVEVTSVRPEKRLVRLATTCTTGDRVVCQGEALVLAGGIPRTAGTDTAATHA